MKKVFYTLAIVIVGSTLGCEDEEEMLTISLLETSSEGIESEGSKSFTYVLSRATNQDVTIEFENIGNALLNGDYRINSFVATISEGNTSVEVPFELVDDPVIEPEDKNLEMAVVEIRGMDNSISENLTYRYTILDDDEVPADGMQIDLLWQLEQGQDIDLVNLDLFLATDLVVENDLVSDFQLYSVTSENSSGFESIVLNDSAPNGEYYVLVFYNSGSSTVDFEVNLSSLAGSDNIEASLEASDSGSGIFLGPIIKNGAISSRTRSVWSVNNHNNYYWR